MQDISARNRLAGTITSIVIDGVTAEVTIRTAGGDEIAAVITRSSVERLVLTVGAPAWAIVKATDVMIGSATPTAGEAE